MEQRTLSPFGRTTLADWPLDPDITYLNHGTVGVTPRRILAIQQEIHNAIERGPSQFMLRQFSGLVGHRRSEPTLLRQAAAKVAHAFGAAADDLVFVDNATTGANAVLRSFPLAAGDEILLTDHNYGSTARIAAFVARERQAHVRTVRVPYPKFDAARLVDDVAGAIGPRTRIAVLDHVTSETALVFPLADLSRVCRERGVAVLADGAHAPGMLPLDLPALGVDWYSGNLHKWALAPRGCGVLWARADRQTGLHPPVISWGLDQGFVAEFDWVGTRDPSPFLTAPHALALLATLGADDVRRYNHDLAWQAAKMLTTDWDTPFDLQESSVGSMVTVPLPTSLGASADEAAILRDALLDEDRIEVQLHAGHGRLWVRVSAQTYNDVSDVERLSAAILRRR
jgi:isopenicillin-N epimerase